MSLEPRIQFLQRATLKTAKLIAPRLARLKTSIPKRPVFLIGCARSGTTLLERLLAMHHDIADWSEANEIWDPSWFPWREESIARPPLEFDPVEHTKGWEAQNLHRIEEIRSVFGHFQALSRRAVFLNKTPFHSFRIQYLIEHFPGAKLIYIRRDGRAVVHSYMKKLTGQGKLREWPLEQREAFQAEEKLARWLAVYWKKTCEEAERQDRSLRLVEQGIMQTLTYEELCADTPGTLKSVSEFIGIDISRFRVEVWDQTIRDSNYKWNENLDANSQEAVLDAIGSSLKIYGYV